METEIDKAFISRVYRTSAVVWPIGVCISYAVGGLSAAVGWTVGSAFSVALLRGIELLVYHFFVPTVAKNKVSLTKIFVVKLSIITLILLCVVLLGGRDLRFIAGFCAGLILAQGVIVLKTLGLILARN